MNGAVDRVRENASTEADMVASVNKQLIRSVFEAWANGDSKAFFNVLAPNVEWTVIGTGPVSQCYKSRQAFLEGAVNPLSEKLAGPIAPTVENIHPTQTAQTKAKMRLTWGAPGMPKKPAVLARSIWPDSLPWGKMESQYASRGQKVALGGQASRIPLRIHKLQKPSIAAVNGHAIGVGMGVALACDIRYTSEKAVFSEAFARMGLIPGDGSCWQLPRLIGMSNTLLLQYTGDRIDGPEAYRLGIASKLFSDDELWGASFELASRLAQGATQSHALIKYLVHKSLSMDFEDALDLAHVAQEQVRKTEDHKEAVQAFLEKRPANLKGR